MNIPTEILLWGLGIFGTLITTGIGWIIRSLTGQGAALALLVARVGTLDVGSVNQRILDLETDMARVWGIYDAWKGPSAPHVTADRYAGHH